MPKCRSVSHGWRSTKRSEASMKTRLRVGRAPIRTKNGLTASLLIRSKIGMYIAMTMPPTTPPRNAIMTGSSSVSMPGDRRVHLLLVEVGDLRQHRVERAGRLADADHLHDHRREHARLASGAEMVSPRSMLVRVTWIASSMMALPAVRAVMSRPSRIGTPEAISVDSVRQNRATAILRRMFAEDRQLQQQAVDDAAPPRWRSTGLNANAEPPRARRSGTACTRRGCC
jgi:hypothetical protein